ncbi:MAG: glycosyltransferase family 4 protein [Prevotella sp.]
MKVVIVCGSLGFGGAERVAVMLANELARRDHEVIVAANLFEEVTYRLDECVGLRNLVSTNANKMVKWFSAVRILRNICREERPDMVVGIMSTCSLVAKTATMGLGIPIVATEHNAFERPGCRPFTPWEWFTKFVLNRFYDCVTVLTSADKAVVAGHLRGVHVMPNPLSLAPMTVVPHKDKVVLAVGRIDAWHSKGFDVLLNSYSMIAKRFPEWRLKIAGKCRDKKNLDFLRKLALDSGIEDCVEFCDFQNDIQALYREASVFVLSSRYEGFGLVLIEAMSQGCACVACDFRGRQREIFADSKCGLLVCPDCPQELADAMSVIMENEKVRSNMQLASIERSRRYTVDRIGDKWEHLLCSVAGSKM